MGLGEGGVVPRPGKVLPTLHQVLQTGTSKVRTWLVTSKPLKAVVWILLVAFLSYVRSSHTQEIRPCPIDIRPKGYPHLQGCTPPCPSLQFSWILLKQQRELGMWGGSQVISSSPFLVFTTIFYELSIFQAW